MLKDIKVYRRGKVLEEVKAFKVIYTLEEGVFLEVLNVKKIVKQDPLEKFKPTKNWWFSEDGNYILIENDKEFFIEISYKNCYIKAYSWKQLDLKVGSRFNCWSEEEIENIKEQLENILNVKIELEKKYSFNLLEIGEEKYLKLKSLCQY